jgi:hypothetical protein
MATRSFIAMENESGFKSVYAHWDGGFSGVGATLHAHYQDPKKIAALIENGDISELGSEIGEKHDFEDRTHPEWTKFYGRDRGDDGNNTQAYQADTLSELRQIAKGSGCEYLYIYRMDGNWYFSKLSYKGDSWSKLMPLSEDLVKRHEA